MIAQPVAAGFNKIEKLRNLIWLQTNNFFFMELRHIDKQRRICLNQFLFEIIGIERPKCRQFSFQAFFPVGGIRFLGTDISL